MFLDSLYKKIRPRKYEVIALIIIIAFGIFFRTYNFSDWLHFEIDQVYDFDIVAPAVSDGIENLPLLGPNVGGGMLRLGPAFYYMEYASAKIFGNTPVGHAMNVLILSILALPLFYIFCKKYFSTIESLGLLAVFSFSLYSVMYSRFSWSPNVLPFLMLFSFYALLKSVSQKEKHPARWFLVAVTGVTITSQIHFNSLFVAPLIAVAFTAIKHPKFSWKVWLAGFGIIFLIYSPVILNDIKTKGENLSYLQEKFSKTKPSNFLKTNTIIQTIEYISYEYFFINTANDQINGIKLRDKGFSCESCRENLPIKIAAIILLFLALMILMTKFFKEKDVERKNFLLLIILWFLASFYLVYSVADGYRMYPRFFLLASPLAVILYGFILKLISPEKNKLRFFIFLIIIASFSFFNIQRITYVFLELKNSPETVLDKIDTGDVFPCTNRITLEEQEAIADYIKSKSAENDYPVYVKVASEYAPSFWYLLEKRGVHYFNDFNKKISYAQSNYFSINYSTDEIGNINNFREKESTIFGKLKVRHIEPIAATYERQPESEKIMRYDLRVMSQLLTWKKLFQK